MKIEFKSDTKHRKGFFTSLSFSHPAKMHLSLQLWLIDNYTKEGETILDSMAGSGTLMVACSMGRHVILVELEDKFVQMQKGNWEKVKIRGAQLGYQMGNCQILQGEARNLTGLLADKIISVDAVITSPPYEEHQTGAGLVKNIPPSKLTPGSKRAWEQMGYQSKNENIFNIGNLKGSNYLQEMLKVYQQCFAVLKPEGLLILVTKNFIRNKKEIRLDEDTIKICEQAGFQFVERHYRKLTSQSFWRVIYSQKYPDAPVLDKEDILVFNK